MIADSNVSSLQHTAAFLNLVQSARGRGMTPWPSWIPRGYPVVEFSEGFLFQGNTAGKVLVWMHIKCAVSILFLDVLKRIYL